MGKRKRPHRKKLSEVSLEQDIRYRGPLSYRHLRIFGWLCIVVAQVAAFLALGTRFSAQLEAETVGLVTVLGSVGSMSVPFLLLANYALILDTSDGYKRQFAVHAGAAGIIIVMSLFIINRYVVGTASVLLGGRQKAVELLNTAAAQQSRSGSIAFNLFIDLLLCNMFMFFLNYRPKRLFRGKKIWILRSLAVLPVLYETASLVLRILAAQGVIILNYNFFPFLTTKPPMMFLVFLVLAFFIKFRERLFCKNGRTHKEYEQFLNTRRNSLQFSVFTTIVFVVAAILDIVILIVVMDWINLEPSVDLDLLSKLWDMGIGNSIILLPMAPFAILFSYTRTHKRKFVDLLIPIMGILLSVFVYLEGAYQALRHIPGVLETFQ